MEPHLIRISKFLSLVLRHKPEAAGLQLDTNGWAVVDELLAALRAAGMEVDLPLLQRVVATNDKKRFSFSPDGQLIRASQGHSINVDLALEPVCPPAVLYHGTATRFLDSIREQGLRPGSRQHVHLSADSLTAAQVGARHGHPVVLTIDSAGMYSNGLAFYRSDNDVWLTGSVPVVYMHFPGEQREEP